MKNFQLSIFCLVVASPLFASYCSPGKKTQRVVIIALDGISVEGYQKANLPNLDKLIEGGVIFMDTRNVMPSVTLPNWTSHLTGSGPEQHGVVDNGWELTNYILSPVEKDDKGYYPSLFKILKEQVPGVKTAFYYNWKNLIYPYNQTCFDEIAFEEADVHIGEFLEKLKAEGLYEETHFMFLSDHGGVGTGHGGVITTEMEVPWAITGPGIKKGHTLSEPNNTVNTAASISYLFNCEIPLSWTGEVPMSIFK